MSLRDEGWPVELQLLTESADERKARVAKIARHVTAGEYQVPAGEIADAVVAFFSRSLEPPTSLNPGSPRDSC